MADWIDDAQAVIELHQGESIRRNLDAARRIGTPADFDGKTCYECGVDIPTARLAHGFFRCVHCAEDLERDQKRAAHVAAVQGSGRRDDD